jgi:hypothetical protein
MPDEQIKPVDQVAAGGTSQPANPAGIIDALRSRGPMPQSALSNIMQPPAGMMGGGLMGMSPMLPPPPAPANLGLAAGSGMLAGLQGRPNTNPYLTQHTEQQDADYRRQQDMLRMQERMQEQRVRQNEVNITMTRGVLDSMDPDSPNRRQVADQLAGLYKATYGVPATGDWFIKREQLSPSERNEVDKLIVAGVDNPGIIARLPKLATMPSYLEQARGSFKNPAFRRYVTGKTAEEEEVDRLTTQQDLSHLKAKEAANERLAAGKATPGDYIILGAKNAKEVGERVFAEYVGTGKPIPPELQPYYEIGKRSLNPEIKTRFEAYMAQHPGDPAAAIEAYNRDERGNKKPTASEYEMLLRTRQQSYFDKIRSGQQLTPAEKRDAAAIDGYLRGEEPKVKGQDFRPVKLTKDDRGGYQAVVNDLALRLSDPDQTDLPVKINTPGALAADGRPKERVIEEAYAREHPTQRIQVQYQPGPEGKPGKFVIVNLRERSLREGEQATPDDTAPGSKAPASADGPRLPGQGRPQPQQQTQGPLFGAAKPPANQNKPAAVAELNRLMSKGMSKQQSIDAMKKAGWDLK